MRMDAWKCGKSAPENDRSARRRRWKGRRNGSRTLSARHNVSAEFTVAILGAGGMLARDLVTVLSLTCQVVALDRERCDITSLEQARAALAETKADTVINCAAATDVDRCEREPEWAYRVNAWGARNVAAACEARGSRLLHISTDFVFPGDADRPYHEWDDVSPINLYGHSKLAGEREVLQLCSSSTVVRTQWLYGCHGRSFPRAILHRAKTRPEGGLRIVDDQIGAPTWTVHLARKIAWLVEQQTPPGVFHINNAGECNRYEWAVELLRAAGLDEVPVTPCKSSEFKTDARRPSRSTLRRLALEYAGSDDMPDWREGVAGYVAELREAGEL